jgi:thiol-disulfide isomerase/thioredoxin
MAPELEGGLAWLNTDKALKLKELRGQVVILDFWTYCCINCMHVLPILHTLEQKHAADPVVVIGVHSAKFQGERDPDRIREAMLRYGVTHPVYVDSEMHVWEKYGIRSWPTLVVIRPNGLVAAALPGEPDPAELEALVGDVLAKARTDGSLAKGPVTIHRPAEVDTGPLAFPGKVRGAPDGRIFVSDSGHHRVLVLDANGRVLDTIGSGLKGVRAGTFEDAAFDDPEGLALDGDHLYIADARGHVIVRADLHARTVMRVAGTGELGVRPLDDARPALSEGLRSPWALALDGRRLLFTVAGSHQIGVLDLDAGTVARFAGNGREAIVDGDHDNASFAQPSGLTNHDGTLYVADSESSGVRAVSLKTGETKTVIGTGLFDFGDRDGPVGTALLQHPLGVAWTSAGLVVADTYNNKVKRFLPDLSGLDSVPLVVNGKRPFEPGGLGVASDGALLVADTNNHRLLRVPVAAGRLDAAAAREIHITGSPPPAVGFTVAQTAPLISPTATSGAAYSAELAPVATGAGARKLMITLRPPADFELTKDAPYDVSFQVSEGSSVHLSSDHFRGHQSGTELRLDLPIDVAAGPAGATDLIASFRGVICDARNHASCYPIQNRFRLPLTRSPGAADPAFIATLVPPQKK